MATRKIGLQIESRQFDFEWIERADADRSKALEGETVTVGGEDFRVYRLTASSEKPVLRWDWNTGTEYLEVLSHESKDINLKRFKDGASVRDTHWGAQVGVIHDAEPNAARKLEVGIRMSKGVRGAELERDINTRIVRNVSIRYMVQPKPKIGRDEKTGMEVRTFKWEPIHLSLEPDPADPSVGVGRAQDDRQRTIDEIEVEEAAPTTTRNNEEKTAMTDEERAALEKAAKERTDAAVKAAVDARNAEASEIRVMARGAGMDEEDIDKLVGSGRSKADSAIEILAHRKPEVIPGRGAEEDGLGGRISDLSRGDRKVLQRRYSIGRAIEQAIVLRNGGKPTGLEGEMHQQLAKGRSRGGEGHFLVPWSRYTDEEKFERAERVMRAMGGNVALSGAELVYDSQPTDIMDAFRPKLALLRRGATFLPGLRGPLPMPRFTSDATLYWSDENPPTPTAETAVNTDASWLRDKALTGKLPIPKQLLQTAAFAVESRLTDMLAAAAAVKIEKGSLYGTGTAYQPLGLWNLPGVVTRAPADTSGKKPVFGDFVDMTTDIYDADADGATMGFITTTGMAGYARKNLEFSAAGSTRMWSGDNMNGQLAGFGASGVNTVRRDLGSGADEHGVFFGVWPQYNVATFGDALEILADPFTQADQQKLVLHLFMLADAGTTVPESFCIMTPAKVK